MRFFISILGKFFQFVMGAAIFVIGGFSAWFYFAFRLGRDLHLDWIFQSDLPYWENHMGNLIDFVLAGAMCMGGFLILARLVFRILAQYRN